MMDRVAGWVRDARRLVVLTGAGMSAESGVPVFRGSGGLWRNFRPEDLATPDAFRRQPELVWEWYLWRRARIAAAQPHDGHRVIARLETARAGVTLLTQNVDGLHERAGSRSPVELHGNLWRVRCAKGCGVTVRDREAAPPRAQLRCECGAWLRPDVVWFGEALDAVVMESALQAVAAASVVLVVGTSAVVYPVAALPQIAQQSGARLVEVNVDDTALSPYVDAALRGPAGDVLPELERRL
jgi:NAD-dependent deacetylase